VHRKLYRRALKTMCFAKQLAITKSQCAIRQPWRRVYWTDGRVARRLASFPAACTNFLK
jgi:hypothetical protein